MILHTTGGKMFETINLSYKRIRFYCVHLYEGLREAHYIMLTLQGKPKKRYILYENEIVQIASTGVKGIDMHSVVASHLVVAEPTTVSFGQRNE